MLQSKYVPAFFILGCYCCSCFAQERDFSEKPGVKQYLAEIQRFQNQKRNELTASLKAIDIAIKSTSNINAKRKIADKKNEILKQIETIDREGVEFPAIPLNVAELKSGDIGTLNNSSKLIVVQVIDEDTVHLIPEVTKSRVEFSGLVARQSFYKEQGNRFVIHGLSTKGLTDNTDYRPDETLFEVSGTERYTTITGSTNTIVVLKPFDVLELKKAYKAYKALSKGAESTKAPIADLSPKVSESTKAIKGESSIKSKVEQTHESFKPGLAVLLYERLPTQKGNEGFVPIDKFENPISEAVVVDSVQHWTYDATKNAVASGHLKIEEPGEYIFRTYNYYDRNALFVNGRLICPYRGSVAGGSEPKGEERIVLEKGYVSFASIGYVDAKGSVDVSWRPPGQKELSVIPSELLFHEAAKR